MSRLIRLTPGQKKATYVQPPFGDRFFDPEKLSALMKSEKPDQEAITLALVPLAMHVVGRYLYYWPSTIRHKDDLISEALLATVKTVKKAVNATHYQWLPYRLVYTVRGAIEVYLNTKLPTVAASFSTNKRRAARGQPLEIHNARELKSSDSFALNEGEHFVEVADAWETWVNSCDEEIVNTVLTKLQEKYNVEGDIELVTELTQIAKGAP